jgi:CRISPR-associated protein Cmr2
MTNHLFLFTIGPVQGFIAQARKTRDLYAGSQILSALVAEGMRAFKKEFPTGKVIFPAPSEKDGASLPNRFIGKVNAEPTELKEKAEAVQRAVEAKWMKIAEQSLKDAGVDPRSPRSEAQIKALLDIHWVFNKIENDYAEAYKELERLGGAVKNIRQFEQLYEAGRKCSVDGTNNALFYQKGSDVPAFMKNPEAVRGFALSRGEGLSAVSLTKRFYPIGNDKFPSTAEVTLMSDEKNLSPDNLARLVCFKNLFKKEKIVETCVELFTNGFKDKITMINPGQEENWNDQFDYQMLYEENLNEKNLPNSEQRELLKHLHKTLKGSLKTRYYAVILFDGDHMGKWLSGEKNRTTDNLEEFHTALSDALAKFGKEAREYLDKSNGNGHTVYAGGDDFLGFVNIHHLFDVMKYLRIQFDKIVNQRIAAYKKEGENLTFSAGIVIAHYKMPFLEVLKKAREVEKAAKKEGERNAFSIAVMKHSGEIQQAIYKWDQDEYSPSGCSNWEALEQIYKALDKDDGDFSNTFIQNLTVEIMGLTGVDMVNLSSERDGRAVQDNMHHEIHRLVERAWKEGQKKDDAKIKALSKGVVQLWEKVPKESDHRPRNFIHALHVTDFLTRKITQEQ